MAEVYKEVAKLDGVPVQQLITMGAAGQPAAAGASSDGSAAPAPQQPAQQQPAAQPPSIGGALGGALGGRFGLGRKKTPPADQPAAPASGSGSHPADNRRAPPGRCSK